MIWTALFNAFKMLLGVIFNFLKFLIFPLSIIFIIILFMLIYFNKYWIKKGIIPSQKPNIIINKRNFFQKLLIDFPKQLSYDRLTRNPYDFGEYGLHMICGRQGSGKTITAVYLLQQWKQKYPKMQIYSNSSLTFEDGELKHWRELFTHNNGKYGVVNFLDEIHTWFSNAESKDLPPEVLGEISQQRKQRKCIVGTAQVFGKIAKPLREQTSFVYRPYTFFGCITIVKMADANDYDMDKDKFKKSKGMFFFVHNQEIREAYDTYKRISRYSNTTFSKSLISGTSSVEDVR